VKILLKLFAVAIYYPFYENKIVFYVHFTHLFTIILLKYFSLYHKTKQH